MKAEVVDLGPCKKRLSIELEADKVKEQYESVCSELKAEAELPGFRKGRVPRALLLGKFGKQIAADAKSKLVQSSFADAVKEKALEVVGEPDLDLEKIAFDAAKPLAYQCEVEVKPVFDPPECEGLKLERPAAEVADADVEEMVKRLCRRFAEVHPVSEPAQAEDFVIADVRLTVEGKDAWKEQELPLALVGERVVGGLGFELPSEVLLGAKAGEKRTAAVELPVNFHIKEYAGKAAEATLEVKDVKRPKLPELIDELAGKLGYESAEKLRALIREKLASEKKSAAEEALRDQVIDQLIARTKFELPPKLLETASARDELRRHYRLRQMGVGELPDEAREEIHAVSRKQAERDLRAFLIFEKLAKAQKIEVSDAELDKRVGALAAERGADPVAFRAHAEEHGELEMLRADMLEQKAIQFIIGKAEVKDVAAIAPRPKPKAKARGKGKAKD
jgi:trigger factor